MAWIRRCYNLFRQEQLQAGFEEEIAFHLAARREELTAAGCPEAEAEREARRRFGNQLRKREQMRDARLIGWLDDLWQDFRHALRLMRRSPAMTAAAVGSLALAIGANSAIFSVMDAAVFKTLPVPEPERLVRLTAPARPWAGTTAEDDQFDYPLFRRLRESAGTAAKLFAAGRVFPVEARIGAAAETAAVQHFSGEAFGVLGVVPALGRTLAPYDDLTPGAHPVVVLSYAYWARRFGKVPDVLGRRLMLQGTEFEIVGVAQPGFSGTEVGNPADLWAPTMMREPYEGLVERGWRNFVVFGRLQDGVPAAQLRARVQPVFSESLREMVRGRVPEAEIPAMVREYLKSQIAVRSAERGTSQFRQQFSTALWIVAVTASLVLLVACGNLANLLLARSAARHGEMAMRVSLGATRSRLVRQVLTESAVIAGLGSLGGLLLAVAAAPALVRLLDRPDLPARLELTPDLRLLGFVLAAGCVTGLAFGLLPALRACASHTSRSLREESARRGVTGRVLIAAQAALSFVLLAVSFLFIISLRNLLVLSAGFERDNLLLAEVETAAPLPSEARQRIVWEQIRLRLRSLPRVQSCAYSTRGLFSGNRRTVGLLKPGAADRMMQVVTLQVSPGFFETMGTHIQRGREFLPADEGRPRRPVIVNRALAQRWFGETDPVGRSLELGGTTSEVVGVAEDAKYGSLREAAPALVYLPGESAATVTFAIRTVMTSADMAARLRQELPALGGGLRLRGVRTQTELVANTLSRERLLAHLSIFFALTGMVLACIGVYGVLSYLVARRTREIGIHSALGAPRRRIARAVVGHLLPAFVVGTGLGAALAAGLARFIESMLFGLRPADPLPFCLAGAVLAAAALIAAAIPALRATRVDPAMALRCD
jgi:predicted permease